MSENNGSHRNPKFVLGKQLVSTQGALELLEQCGKNAAEFIQRHLWPLMTAASVQPQRSSDQKIIDSAMTPTSPVTETTLFTGDLNHGMAFHFRKYTSGPDR